MLNLDTWLLIATIAVLILVSSAERYKPVKAALKNNPLKPFAYTTAATLTLLSVMSTIEKIEEEKSGLIFWAATLITTVILTYSLHKHKKREPHVPEAKHP